MRRIWPVLALLALLALSSCEIVPDLSPLPTPTPEYPILPHP